MFSVTPNQKEYDEENKLLKIENTCIALEPKNYYERNNIYSRHKNLSFCSIRSFCILSYSHGDLKDSI